MNLKHAEIQEVISFQEVSFRELKNVVHEEPSELVSMHVADNLQEMNFNCNNHFYFNVVFYYSEVCSEITEDVAIGNAVLSTLVLILIADLDPVR